MKVSVLITTYNQEAFIAQAVKSVLMQELNFAYEIVIGEDVSTDATRKIVLEFQERYPEKIRVLLRDPVAAERDRAAGVGGKGGFVNGLNACQGQYVALLDGDDFWTDPHKLQKQVDFLDSHPDFAISCHNATMLFEDGSSPSANLLPPDHREVSTIEDLLLVNMIPTCSAVFRRGLFRELPEWFFSLKLGDWPIHIMNAQHGKIGYFNEVMATYRIHQGAFWSTWSSVNQRLEIIKMLRHIDAYLDFKYKKQIRQAQANWYWEIAQMCYKEDDRIQGRSYAGKYFWLGGFRARRNLLGFFLKLRTPTLYYSLRSVKEFARSFKTHHQGIIGH
jgi:glycosyltransferase involved in cell wall biosynthesis